GGPHRLSVEAAGRCWVVGDPARLEQVLSNLLDNAVKYSPDGGEVRLTLEPDGEGVLLRIRDQGIGLPPGATETIFEPFDRAVNAERRHLPGLGLGLYICRSIVEQHGGRIWAESPGEGNGTTVAVWLPRCGEPEQVQDEPAGGHPAPGG
ncbi:MAG: ATP-binding protein, partial [Chloroflexota bacterium]|nr:ATP-binding protein [Chloroflexota bacterium]